MEKGDVVAIVGDNAAGKSTLLRTLAGHQLPVSGEVRINGLVPNPESVLFRRLISTVIDDDAFFSNLTVEEHLTLVSSGHGTKDVSRSVNAELSLFELINARNAFPRHLSSGQRRRMVLAAAFIRPFQLLVLDEPEQRLDTMMRRIIATRLETLCRGQNRATLIATHDTDLLLTCSTRCLVIDEGVVTEATPHQAVQWMRRHR